MNAACMDKYIPKADRCIDPFHAIAWAQVALDDVGKAASERARIILENKEVEVVLRREQK
jgi:transposase